MTSEPKYTIQRLTSEGIDELDCPYTSGFLIRAFMRGANKAIDLISQSEAVEEEAYAARVIYDNSPDQIERAEMLGKYRKLRRFIIDKRNQEVKERRDEKKGK